MDWLQLSCLLGNSSIRVYLGERIIRVTVLLEYLNCEFLAFCFVSHWSLILFLVRAISFLQVICVIVAKLLNYAKSVVWFWHLFCLLFNQFLTAKRHSIPIFNLFLTAVYHIGMTEVQCIKSLINPWQIYPKFDTGICLQTLNKCIPISAKLKHTYTSLAIFAKCAKRKQKQRIFLKVWLLISQEWLKESSSIWNVASPEWRAPPL